jgi:uncharacterized membrane protein YecN with MAPEG domain
LEDLATFVAYLFIALGVISLLNIGLAILARRQKIRLWVGHVSNTIVGLIAIWCISIAWPLAMFSLVSLAVASITLTWPKSSK